MMLSLTIFVEKPGLHIPIEKKLIFLAFVIYFICGLTIIVIKSSFLDKNLVYVFFGLMALTIPISIANSLRLDYLHGRLQGEIFFEKEAILIEKSVFLIKDIESLHFNCGDYLGKKRIFESKGFLEFHKRGISQGVENLLTIELKDTQKVYINFQQLREDHMLAFKEILIYYYKSGIINWLHLLEILKIEDYGEIQKFKLQIK